MSYGRWIIDEDGRTDFVEDYSWEQLSKEEADEIVDDLFPELQDEDIDAMYDYFQNIGYTE